MHLSWNIEMIWIIIHSDNDIYISMKAILIPDYGGSVDIAVVLTYTENNKMIPERERAYMLPRLCGAGIVNDADVL